MVYIGNARISENGTVNGTKGDQTGREVMIQPWSQGGFWQYVIRPKSENIAKKIAAAMVDACNNPNIGYSQADRLSLYNLASKNGYKLDKVGKCNCDCSSLVAVCVNAAGVKVSPSMYTGNELDVLKATGKFTIYTTTTYTHSQDKLRAGDILLRAGHTAIVTAGAIPFKELYTKPKSVSTIAQEVIDGKWGTGSERKKRLTAAGYDYKTVQAAVNKKLAAKKKAVSTVAKEIVSGTCSDPRWKSWGNGLVRKARLKKAGYTAAQIKEIQSKVNEIMRSKK